MLLNKSYIGSHLQRGRTIGSWNLWNGQLKLGGLQKNGGRYSRYLSHVYEMRGYLYDCQYGFRPEYSCEFKIVTVR
jgi:hypothetical protein